MKKEYFDKLENPPENWHTTDKIEKCYGGVSGEACGKITDFMYPIFGKFVCEDHRGNMMGMPLCCTHCFEPYWPNFADRAEQFGDKWTGHCRGTGGFVIGDVRGNGCCHERDRKKQAELEALPEYQKQKAEEKEERIKYNLEHADEIRDEYVIGRVEFSGDGGYFGQNVVYGKIDGADNHTAHDGSGYLEPMTLVEVKEKAEIERKRGGHSKIYKLVEINP